MDPIQVKKYLKKRKIAPLQDIAFHFRTDISAIKPMLEILTSRELIREGRLHLGRGPDRTALSRITYPACQDFL